MTKNKQTLRLLKNIEGKRLLEKNKLEYSKQIINLLQNQPQILPELIEQLELTEKDLFELLSGDKKGNITLYNETLKEAYNLTKKRKNK